MSVSGDDQGEYRCVAENSEGVISASARLTVQGKLVFCKMCVHFTQVTISKIVGPVRDIEVINIKDIIIKLIVLVDIRVEK